MEYSILRVITLIISAATLLNARVITESGACLTDLFCSSTQFCNDCSNNNFCPGKPFTCMPKIPRGAECPREGSCRNGNFCGPRTALGTKFFCQALRPINASCEFWASMCKGENTRCNPQTKKCEQVTTGFAGFPCGLDSDCQQRNGFFCNASMGKCERKKKGGSSCGISTSNFECRGYCNSGTCRWFRKIGDKCNNDGQCDVNPFTFVRSNERICNSAENGDGVCVKTNDLLTTLGATCNPQNDRCDRQRGMFCLWKKERKGYVCQQDGSLYCTPNSKFSRCTPNGAPVECRVEKNTLSFLSSPPSPFFTFKRCVFKLEFSRRGQICGLIEKSVCPKHLSCERIDGVQPFISNTNFEHPVQDTTFCVKIKKSGETCGNKFFSKCGAGLKCVNGRCVEGETGTKAVTHLGNRVDCSRNQTPCAPGLVCDNEENVCRLRIRLMSEGEPCYLRSLFRPVGFFNP